MKLIDIIKESSNTSELLTVGSSLKEKGWQVKLASYYPTINIISPTGKKTSIIDNKADDILSKIPNDVYGKENRRSWVLGYLSSKGMLE